MNWSALARFLIKMTVALFVAHNVYHTDRNCCIIFHSYVVFLLGVLNLMMISDCPHKIFSLPVCISQYLPKLS